MTPTGMTTKNKNQIARLERALQRAASDSFSDPEFGHATLGLLMCCAGTMLGMNFAASARPADSLHAACTSVANEMIRIAAESYGEFLARELHGSQGGRN